VSWVDEAQALLYTGLEVTPEELSLASGMITSYVGRSEEEPETSILAVDRRWLAMATAYQAAWLRGKPGLLEYRESHKSSSADGVQISRESDSQIMLAPMAARCLRNLSWVGNRTTYQGPMPFGPAVGALNEAVDRSHGWKPMPL
jgi:hypothetical protein